MTKAEGISTTPPGLRTFHLWLTAVLVISLLPYVSFSQIPIRTYTAANDTFYWKKYTHLPAPKPAGIKKLSIPGKGKQTDRFCDAILPEFPWFSGDSGSEFSPSDLRKHLTALDLNHDGVAEYLFAGPGPGDGEIVRLYISHETKYELVFEDYQCIAVFEVKDKKLRGIQTGDPGINDSPLRFLREYTINWEGTTPVFIKGKQLVWYRYTEEPPAWLPASQRFETVADTLMVRASAAVLNVPYIPWLESFGNIVARYRTRVEGVILAEKTTPAGIWYFVEIWPSSTPSASILYGTEKWPTFLRGWVAGGSIKRR